MAAVDGRGAIVGQRYVFWVLPCAVEVAHHLARAIHLQVARMSWGQLTSSVCKAKPHICRQLASFPTTCLQDQTARVACTLQSTSMCAGFIHAALTTMNSSLT